MTEQLAFNFILCSYSHVSIQQSPPSISIHCDFTNFRTYQLIITWKIGNIHAHTKKDIFVNWITRTCPKVFIFFSTYKMQSAKHTTTVLLNKICYNKNCKIEITVSRVISGHFGPILVKNCVYVPISRHQISERFFNSVKSIRSHISRRSTYVTTKILT